MGNIGNIGHGYGSEWHLLRYLGYHRERLNEVVLKETGGSSIHWLDFPFRSACQPLQDDAEWTGMQAIPEAKVASQNGRTAWQNYWPTTGMAQNWDAVGQLHTGGKREWLLFEAKAHVKEMDSHCGASPASQFIIDKAFDETAQAVTNAKVPTTFWRDEFYQYANRLTVLHFLNNICVPSIPARLVFIYFCGDRAGAFKARTICPVNAADWQPHIDGMYTKLDIDRNAPLMQRVHHVFIPINPNC